jgi:hypothetical protein
MTQRISRSAVALVAAGLLASPFVASAAQAQTVTVNPGFISATAKFNPTTPPAGVSGVTVTYDCKNVFTGQTLIVGPTTFGNATILPTSGAFVTNLGLTGALSSPATPGSSCIVRAQLAGSANTATPSIAISVGGADRTVSASHVR